MTGLYSFYLVSMHRHGKNVHWEVMYTRACVLFIGWGTGEGVRGVLLPIFPVYSNDLSNIRGYKTLHSKLVSYTQCTRPDFQMRG